MPQKETLGIQRRHLANTGELINYSLIKLLWFYRNLGLLGPMLPSAVRNKCFLFLTGSSEKDWRNVPLLTVRLLSPQRIITDFLL